MNDLIQDRGGVVAVKRILAGQHPVRDRRQRELIGAAVDGVRCPRACSGDMYAGVPSRSTAWETRRRRPHLGDAEVQHLHELVGLAVDGGEEHVRGLEIAVHDAVRVGDRQR